MANPFEDEEAPYIVLVNERNQHSLWLAAIDVPEGWSVVHGPDRRSSCLEYVEANWTDLRPTITLASPDHASI